MQGERADKFTLRSLLKPLGVSVAVNVCLLALMVRAFTATPTPGKQYMSVELRVPVRITRPMVKQITVHQTLTAQPQSQPKPKPQRIASAKPFSKVLPYRQEMGSRSMPGASTGDSGTQSAQPGTGTGVGEPVGPVSAGNGPGVNIGGSGGDGTSVTGPVSTAPSHTENPPPAVKPQPPKPVAPKPAPVGETRNAQLSRKIKPAYPSEARDEGVEGVVSLTLTISPNGHVSSARVETSSGDRRLDKAALETVRNWTYSPSLKNGTAVEATVRVRVDFRLE